MTGNCDAPYTRFDPSQPPAPLMTGEPDSFAHITMTTRMPSIARTVLADNPYPPGIEEAIRALHDEVQQGHPIRPLETIAPDGADWAEAWRSHPHHSWLDTPWYFAEVFFFRRLLEASGYFGLPAGQEEAEWIGRDPFLPRKQAELQSQKPWQILALALEETLGDSAAGLRALLQHGVWGNRVDLSHEKLAQSVAGNLILEKERENLVVDDAEAVVAHLQNRPDGRPVQVDFISDNAGAELLMDLVLTDFLLRLNWADQVTMHLKAHPTYVSDATPADVQMTIAALKARPEPELTALGSRLEQEVARQRLRLRSNFFWNSSRFFWEIPSAIQSQLHRAWLVIIKGDANYRRLLGDSPCWPTNISPAVAIPYFPTALVALRTLKSDVIVGLQPGQAEALDPVDPAWRVNGKRGIIQFVPAGSG